MSWVDKIKNNFIIITGDGQLYSPLWNDKSCVKEIEFNISEFNFPNQEGTFIDRREVKGNKYVLDIIFQGENHFDIAQNFEISCKDKRPWVIEHPYYGRLIVQPASLSFGNQTLNGTAITGTLLETILRGTPKVIADPISQIESMKLLGFAAGADSFALEIPNPQNLAITNRSLYQSAINSGAPQIQTEGYFNLFNEANSAVLNATNQPLAAIRSLQAVIEAPARFEISVKQRFEILKNQFTLLVNSVINITGQSGKVQFETTAGSILTSMCTAASLPQTNDYLNMVDVISIVEQLIDTENAFIDLLDFLQTDNGGDPDSYVPNFEFITNVVSIVDLTTSVLFEIATGAQQERFIFCETDTNVILLAHRFYGLNDEDVSILRLMNTNGIGLSEIINIRKGRRILYYVL